MPAPACPQPPEILLLPPPTLEPLPAPLTEQAAIEAWAGDIERYWIVRRRYEALQQWGGLCWGPATGAPKILVAVSETPPE